MQYDDDEYYSDDTEIREREAKSRRHHSDVSKIHLCIVHDPLAYRCAGRDSLMRSINSTVRGYNTQLEKEFMQRKPHIEQLSEYKYMEKTNLIPDRIATLIKKKICNVRIHKYKHMLSPIFDKSKLHLANVAEEQQFATEYCDVIKAIFAGRKFTEANFNVRHRGSYYKKLIAYCEKNNADFNTIFKVSNQQIITLTYFAVIGVCRRMAQHSYINIAVALMRFANTGYICLSNLPELDDCAYSYAQPLTHYHQYRLFSEFRQISKQHSALKSKLAHRCSLFAASFRAGSRTTNRYEMLSEDYEQRESAAVIGVKKIYYALSKPEKKELWKTYLATAYITADYDVFKELLSTAIKLYMKIDSCVILDLPLYAIHNCCTDKLPITHNCCMHHNAQINHSSVEYNKKLVLLMHIYATYNNFDSLQQLQKHDEKSTVDIPFYIYSVIANAEFDYNKKKLLSCIISSFYTYRSELISDVYNGTSICRLFLSEIYNGYAFVMRSTNIYKAYKDYLGISLSDNKKEFMTKTSYYLLCLTCRLVSVRAFYWLLEIVRDFLPRYKFSITTSDDRNVDTYIFDFYRVIFTNMENSEADLKKICDEYLKPQLAAVGYTYKNFRTIYRHVLQHIKFNAVLLRRYDFISDHSITRHNTATCKGCRNIFEKSSLEMPCQMRLYMLLLLFIKRGVNESRDSFYELMPARCKGSYYRILETIYHLCINDITRGYDFGEVGPAVIDRHVIDWYVAKFNLSHLDIRVMNFINPIYIKGALIYGIDKYQYKNVIHILKKYDISITADIAKNLVYSTNTYLNNSTGLMRAALLYIEAEDRGVSKRELAERSPLFDCNIMTKIRRRMYAQICIHNKILLIPPMRIGVPQ